MPRQRDSINPPGQNAGTGPGTLAVPAIVQSKGGGVIRGIGENFAANPVTGTGSMSVPIATSPGRSGFGPAVTLAYDSGTGNGPFGLGWQLSLPSIARMTDKDLPRYQDAGDSDTFLPSDAEDLVPAYRRDADGDWARDADGNLAFDETERDGYTVRRYCPRTEGLFARNERWTRLVDGDAHWRTISRENVTTFYGRTAESRIFDPADAARVFVWLVCESCDDTGNAIVYEYQGEDSARIFEDAQGQTVAWAHEHNRTAEGRSATRHPKRIKYGNRTPNRDADWQATDPAIL